ncbi:MAG: flagellar motor switch protein FliM, partial [Firmicutes bacterium]|nr:flagellar motor switch protein FliM [Bacillota bacterium]
MGLVADNSSIRLYDFQRPHQLSRMQTDAINLLMESFLRIAGNFLTTFLRTPVQMEMGALDQISYDQYVDNVALPSVLTVFHANPLPGT